MEKQIGRKIKISKLIMLGSTRINSYNLVRILQLVFNP